MAKIDSSGRCGIYCGACPIYRDTRQTMSARYDKFENIDRYFRMRGRPSA